MASVFSCPGCMTVLCWLAYGNDAQRLNRKNADGIGSNGWKTIGDHKPSRFCSSTGSPSFWSYWYIGFQHWLGGKSQLLFAFSILGLNFRSNCAVKNVDKAKSSELEVEGPGSGSSSFCGTLSKSHNLLESQCLDGNNTAWLWIFLRNDGIYENVLHTIKHYTNINIIMSVLAIWW